MNKMTLNEDAVFFQHRVTSDLIYMIIRGW